MNRIFTEQLGSSLTHSLAKIYYLVGQDPLLLSESQDLICQSALTQGFDEKTAIPVDNQTDWNAVFERCQSIGLFFNKQILLLHLPENLTSTLQQHLHTLISVLNEDILLILQLPKLTKTTEKQIWFTQALQFEPQAVLINCQTPSIDQLPRWLTLRAKSMGLYIEEQAIQLLCYSHENNLLALKQSLQLLALLYPDNKISYARVDTTIAQASTFTPFQWVDALLDGKSKRAQRILEGLKAEDVEPIILLRTLQRDLITLLTLAKPSHSVTLDTPLPTQQLREQFDRLKVWQNRRPFFTQAFKRLTYKQLYLIIQSLADIERLAKHSFSQDIWDRLAELSALICLPYEQHQPFLQPISPH
ncbi:DNA polymerase III subunit delta [Bisgaard Taxon 45]|uniref:DNA polymerase III subunit delta n=1 Tax=Bisgaard Taxon 45 TaxID=304289 RepID=A0ABT9KCN5_9PAST|nr:DNA polymerase III subunit delta [Bisgaard Taxon 45]